MTLRTLLRFFLVGFLTIGAQTAMCDFFKWEVLVFPESLRHASTQIPVESEGEVTSMGNWSCSVKQIWTHQGSELIAEGKTLQCVKGDNVRETTLVCTVNNRNRRFNRIKEDFAVPQFQRMVFPRDSGEEPQMLLFRCFF